MKSILKYLSLGLLLGLGGSTIALAQDAGPPQLSSRDRAAIRNCAQSSGMPRPDSGTQPTDAERSAMESCLRAAGITLPPPPPGGPRGHDGPPPVASDDSDSGSNSGGGAAL